ncbi:hypothetical protein CcCBS67573_g03196 [Chytriomyces confervae]|uniref:Secreted protein n=1 Tax=Chytriomyces confervae TaxID=246404 RepID=A0A507FGZ3_9FUNG|nr:hypothetical protein CcCBS67573_g03196 [Chytriomyces confervae]
MHLLTVILLLSAWIASTAHAQLLNQAQTQAMDTKAWVPTSDPDVNYCGVKGTCLQTVVSYFVKSAPCIMYMQVFVVNSADAKKSFVSTATFYPRVDEYSELIVPNSNAFMSQYTDASQSIQIQMVMIVDNQLYKSGMKSFTAIDQTTVCVPARTVVVNLNRGKAVSESASKKVITNVAVSGMPFVNGGLQWSSTDCALSACSCVESICAYDCRVSNAQLTVRVGWTGTDGNGAPMNSLGSDIWRFENAL